MTSSAETYQAAYARWQSDPADWWRDAADAIDWIVPPTEIFSAEDGPYGRWFPDAVLNVSANCLDRHVALGRGDQPALIWDSPLSNSRAQYTYRQLRDLTARFAGALRGSGVGAGDRVLIYMPMIPEAVVAMLACARIGAIHSVVFGGFAPAELAARLADATPKAIVTASCGIEPGRIIAYMPLIEEAIALSAHKSATCFVVQRSMLQADLKAGRDKDFDIALDAVPVDPVPVRAVDPLYILYTSGTTGKPKGIVRDSGGYAVALMRSMRMIYGVQAGDTVWTASDIGWVVGHSYIVYAPLLAGCTTILYEGKPVRTPDAGAFWRVCEDYRVKMLFTAPTAVRAIRQEDPGGTLAKTRNLAGLQTVFLAGERCDPSTAIWLGETLGKPVIDHWWQTETGWPITAGFREFDLVTLPPGCGGRAGPGWTVAVLGEDSQPMCAGQDGDLAIRLPLPPGAAPTLWNDDVGFSAAYLETHPGWYNSGDAGRIDANGDVWVMGRTDDIINVAGHRLSTGAMEEIVAGHPDVVECAVVGLGDALKGHVPVGLFVLSAASGASAEQVARDLVALVRNSIGAIATPRAMIVVPRLPKTRSGKILRKVIRQLGDGAAVVVPSTIEDPTAVDDVRAAIFGNRISAQIPA